MAEIVVQSVWGLGPVSHRVNMRDLDIVMSSTGPVLYGTNGSSGGVISYSIAPSTGGLGFADSQLLGPLASIDGPAHLEQMQIDGESYVVNLGRHAAGLEAIRIGAGDTLDTRMALAGSDGQSISTAAFHASDTRDMLYTGYWGNSDLGIYQVGSGGALSYIGKIGSAFATDGADLVDLRVTQVAGHDVLVFASRYQDAIFSYTVNANGGLAVADVLKMSDGLPVDAPSALEIVESGDDRFAVMASSGTSSLTVFQISPDGHFTPTDHIAASTHTRIQSVTALETVSVGDRNYVIAGGANDGVSLFQLLPGGRLCHLDAQEDLVSASLANVTAVAAQVRGTGLDIYAASESEQGITQLRFELGLQSPMQTGTAGNDVLTGGNNADLLVGNEGADTLSGGAGEDVLMDGPGQDWLTGGAGADIFVLAADGTRDDILDFNIAEDRIDLSGWGRIYDTSALTWSERSVGAVVTYGDEVLIIYTSNGAPLAASDFRPEQLFDLSHTDVSYLVGGIDPAADLTPTGDFEGGAGSDVLDGTSRNDVMRGNLGDDVLRGGAGDDVLNGGAGADQLDGGEGVDWASYEGARGSLRVDLMFPQINTNVAAGDLYVSVENLKGSQGFDNLRGTLGNNVIQGDQNVDYIFGRRGDDTLEGGVGDDVLFGGVGADVLRGGANRDRAQYSESLTAVIVDLADPSRNTGEASGDAFDSIEDLAGGRFADQLFGDSNANRQFGREGADVLVGRAGNDYLNGGAHDDTLDGGAGNDTLRGGQNADTFVFRSGVDLIEDFSDAWDDIQLDPALLGGGAHTAAHALEFASVIGGNTVFEFDSGDQLIVANLADPSLSLDDILFL